MKKQIILLLIIIFSAKLYAQNIGDTIKIKTFNYADTKKRNRDSMITFPNKNLRFSKILLKYNIRCKDGLRSTGANRNLGCGEWDYSCNTNIFDSSRIDSLSKTHSSHTISNHSGTEYNYTDIPVYNKYIFNTQKLVNSGMTNENAYPIGNGTLLLPIASDPAKASTKTQYIYTKAELVAAGVKKGNIFGFNIDLDHLSYVNFLRIKLLSTTDSVFSNNTIKTGLTEVFFDHFNFKKGQNRIQFTNVFNWDSTSNLLIEISYINRNIGSDIKFIGHTTPLKSGIVSRNTHFIQTNNTTNLTIPTNNFNNLKKEITLAFWAKGDKGISKKNTSILEARGKNKKRQLNIHFPWNNSKIYWDCGNDGKGNDRIEKAVAASIIENQWNHWAFTKNTNTGSMKIYLNGVLWHSGTGKKKAIDIDTFILGSNVGQKYIYEGSIDEFSVWDKELNALEIKKIMNSLIDNTHPKYSNLLAYYHFNNGSGNIAFDSKTSTFAPINGLAKWGKIRGNEQFNYFTALNTKPNIELIQGTYKYVLAKKVLYDSVQVDKNLVKEYEIIRHYGTINSDEVIVKTQESFWAANFAYLYDYKTNKTLDSIKIKPINTINIVDLTYQQRFPTKYEIMSFVTPYGINLNLGNAGKTWTFDITDFSPFLNGTKRMNVEHGNYQEDMDIQIWFIVGTPPQNVLNIQQLWTPRSYSFNDINAKKVLNEKTLILNPNGKSFKLRSMITGHGQEGEFIPRDHYFEVDGKRNNMMWKVWKECGENPVYPQGGTWIYDRAGWCPGMATDLKEYNITPFVTAGKSTKFNYGIVTAAGDSRYIVNNQLVTYGKPNFSLDASITDIISPSDKVEHNRINIICDNPEIEIQNTGSTPLTSLTIEYWVNNASKKEVFNWTGNLNFLEKTKVVLPNPKSFWVPVVDKNNLFNVTIKNPNGGTDEYKHNNTFQSNIVIPEVMPRDFALYFRTNSFGHENKYRIVNDWGKVELTRSNLKNNTLYIDTLHLGVGCYQLVIEDSDDDGINFWANRDGAGYARIRKLGSRRYLKTFNPDFGGSLVYNFTVGHSLKIKNLEPLIGYDVYPNPATNIINIGGKNIQKATISLINNLGQNVNFQLIESNSELISINTSHLKAGIYLVKIDIDNKSIVKKIVVE